MQEVPNRLKLWAGAQRSDEFRHHVKVMEASSRHLILQRVWPLNKSGSKVVVIGLDPSREFQLSVKITDQQGLGVVLCVQDFLLLLSPRWVRDVMQYAQAPRSGATTIAITGKGMSAECLHLKSTHEPGVKVTEKSEHGKTLFVVLAQATWGALIELAPLLYKKLNELIDAAAMAEQWFIHMVQDATQLLGRQDMSVAQARQALSENAARFIHAHEAHHERFDFVLEVIFLLGPDFVHVPYQNRKMM